MTIGPAAAQKDPPARGGQRGSELIKRVDRSSTNFYAVKARRDAEFDLLKRTAGVKALAEEGSGYSAYQQWLWYWEPKVFPSGNFPKRARKSDIGVAASKNLLLASPPSHQWTFPQICAKWVELGPWNTPAAGSYLFDIFHTNSRAPGTGQVNFISCAPQNPDLMFTGSAAGGLYYSTDGGLHWTNGGTDFFDHLAAADCIVDPNNAGTWFLATGYAEGVDGTEWNWSDGVYRTSQGANGPWVQIGDFSPGDYTIHKLLTDPNDGNVLFAATSIGLFRTVNALSASPTWSEVTSGTPWAGLDVYGLVAKPGTNGANLTLYSSARASNAGAWVLRSTDAGNTWTIIPGSTAHFPITRAARLGLAVTAANPSLLFVARTYFPKLPNDTWAELTSFIYRYDSSTNTWTDKGPVLSTGAYGSHLGLNPSRASAFAVSPTDENRWIAGNVSPTVWANASSNGPVAWTPSSVDLHDDHHKFLFTPDGTLLLAATHGGIYRSSDLGQTWVSSSKGLGVATILAHDSSSGDPDAIIAGMFDCATNLFSGGSWTTLHGGDGLQPRLDPTNSARLYVTYQGSEPQYSTDGGQSFRSTLAPGTWSESLWGTSYVLEPGKATTLYQASGNGDNSPQILRRDVSVTTPTSENIFNVTLPSAPDPNKPSKIEQTLSINVFGTSKPHVLYATFRTPEIGGVRTFLLFRTTNATATPASSVVWVNIPLPQNYWIGSLCADEEDPIRFWLTFDAGLHTVYLYDPQQNPKWADLTGNLTFSGVRCVIHSSGTDDGIYVGTGFPGRGVFYRDNSTPVATWLSVVDPSPNTGLPNVEIGELSLNHVDNTLRAATFGRGLWKTRLEDPCSAPKPGVDGWMKDSPTDSGFEPDPQTGAVLWDSPDIWVRNEPDFQFHQIPPRFSHEGQHEHPEYAAVASNTPWIYAKVRNCGTLPLSGKVRLYWAPASTGLNWATSWTELQSSPVDTTINGLRPGAQWVVKAQWTDIPSPTGSSGDHYCLLARLEPSGGNDPILGEQTGAVVYGNVQLSNNIAWKNVTILNQWANKQDAVLGGSVIVRNCLSRPLIIRLAVNTHKPGSSNKLEDVIKNLPNDIGQILNRGLPDLLKGITDRKGYRVSLDLGPKLTEKWLAAGQVGSGIKRVGRAEFEIVADSAWLGGLSFAPGEEYKVAVKVVSDAKIVDVAKPPPLSFDLVQYEERSGGTSVMGGERYRVEGLKLRASRDANRGTVR